MPAQDARLMHMMRMCLIELGDRGTAEVGLIDRVRTAVRAHLSEGTLSLDDIAEEVHLPIAVLLREFYANNVSFKSLVEDVRRDLAISYMKQRQLPLSEIALLLGYSELSAFSRAFRRWTGRSPRAFRSAIS
jgi:AraC-like DNA-binding protein